MNFPRKSLIFIMILLHGFSLHSLKAQPSATPVICGTIIEGEVTQTEYYQPFGISLSPGDTLNLRAVPIGNAFRVQATIYDPAQNLVGNNWNSKANTPISLAFTSSASGVHEIQIHGPYFENYGAFTLYIGCTLRDGTVINPGDTPPDALPPEPTLTNDPAPTFSGVGFPGLAPVDFANAAKLPLPAGIVMSGGITPTGGEILGYTLDAAEGDTLDLTFTRLSGNLNLGLVVLSADNQVVFQASLVTSTTLNTRFTLPSAGQYTIGVFRIDLLPPAAPEATAFQVQGTLNP